MKIQIKTLRLILRAFKEKDAPDLLAYLAKPTVNCFLPDAASTLDEVISKIHKRQQDNNHIAVCLKESDQLIGEIFYEKEEPDTYSAGWNFNTIYHGKGYAIESTYAFLDYLFDQAKARRVYAYVEEDNYASQKLCNRLGLRKEGIFIDFISFTNHKDGTPKYENTIQYAILKKEWEIHKTNMNESTKY